MIALFIFLGIIYCIWALSYGYWYYGESLLLLKSTYSKEVQFFTESQTFFPFVALSARWAETIPFNLSFGSSKQTKPIFPMLFSIIIDDFIEPNCLKVAFSISSFHYVGIFLMNKLFFWCSCEPLASTISMFCLLSIF